MGALEDRWRAKMAVLLAQTSDAGLTANELRRKYDDAKGPASPRRSGDAAMHRQFSRGICATPSPATRCWACHTALRDPGANYFACGACGALNGIEPRIARAFIGCAVRNLCRHLTQQHGRKVAGTTALAMAYVIVQVPHYLLPSLRVADMSVWCSHAFLAAFLSVGTVFNFVATMCTSPGTMYAYMHACMHACMHVCMYVCSPLTMRTSPGYVTIECCPLLVGPAQQPPPPQQQQQPAGSGGFGSDAEAGHTRLSRLKVPDSNPPALGSMRPSCSPPLGLRLMLTSPGPHVTLMLTSPGPHLINAGRPSTVRTYRSEDGGTRRT